MIAIEKLFEAGAGSIEVEENVELIVENKEGQWKLVLFEETAPFSFARTEGTGNDPDQAPCWKETVLDWGFGETLAIEAVREVEAFL